MITLTPAGEERIAEFVADYAKEHVQPGVIRLDVIDIMNDRVEMGETTAYELGSFHTISRRPEMLYLHAGEHFLVDNSPEE